MAMYHTVLPNHWILAQIMNNNPKFHSHSVAAFYTGISDSPIVPVIGTTAVLPPSPPCTSHDVTEPEQQNAKPSMWINRSPNYRSNAEFSCKSATAHQTKGTKRHIDFVGKPYNPGGNVKRRTNWNDNNSDQKYRPPVKRPMLTPSRPSVPRQFHRPLELPDTGDKLSEDVWAKYCSSRQTDEVFGRKMRLREAVYLILQEAYSYCGLYVVGSSMNGFGGNTSDMDMCLMLTHNEIDQRTEATTILRNILRSLKKCNYIQKLELIRAKVPILKFRDSISGVEVDLNINNSVGIRNTRLLRCYSKMDWRVCPLVLIVKLWARIQDINDAKSMTISSYSLVLMVIHYLQCGVSPPVLPCLQRLYPPKFLSHSDVRLLMVDEDLPPYHSQNNMSLGELLIGFLDYFSHKFNFSTEAMSVRNGSRLPKHFVQSQVARKNNHGQWKCLCIEEPFDLTNTARSVYDDDVFQRVKEVFRISWLRLNETKDLNSILHARLEL